MPARARAQHPKEPEFVKPADVTEMVRRIGAWSMDDEVAHGQGAGRGGDRQPAVGVREVDDVKGDPVCQGEGCGHPRESHRHDHDVWYCGRCRCECYQGGPSRLAALIRRLRGRS